MVADASRVRKWTSGAGRWHLEGHFYYQTKDETNCGACKAIYSITCVLTPTIYCK